MNPNPFLASKRSYRPEVSLLKAGTQQGQQHLHMGQPCRHVAAVLQRHSGHQLPAWLSEHSLPAELGSSLCSPSKAAAPAPAPARPTPRPSAAKARATTSPPTSPSVAVCGATEPSGQAHCSQGAGAARSFLGGHFTRTSTSRSGCHPPSLQGCMSLAPHCPRGKAGSAPGTMWCKAGRMGGNFCMGQSMLGI